jgi:hypothetical protein
MAEKRFGHIIENWEAAKTEMRTILVGLAKQRQTIAYSDLSLQVQTIYISHRSQAMYAMLTEIHREDEAQNRPGLATLVVRKSDGRPGPGYFTGIEDADWETYWQREFDTVCSYWEAQDG